MKNDETTAPEPNDSLAREAAELTGENLRTLWSMRDEVLIDGGIDAEGRLTFDRVAITAYATAYKAAFAAAVAVALPLVEKGARAAAAYGDEDGACEASYEYEGVITAAALDAVDIAGNPCPLVAVRAVARAVVAAQGFAVDEAVGKMAVPRTEQ